MRYCISDWILKHNRTKTFPLAGKSVGNRIHNPCNWQIFPCELPWTCVASVKMLATRACADKPTSRCFNRKSMMMINKVGDSTDPCLTPQCTGNSGQA